MYASGCPAMRATIATVITTGATTTSADCRPLPSVSAMGGRSLGS